MGLSLDQDEQRTLPEKSGSGATAKVTVRLTRAELRALNRFCAERLLSRSQVVRRAFKAHLLERAIGPEA